MDYYILYRWYHQDDAEDYTIVLGVFDSFEVAWEFAVSYSHTHLISIDDIEVGSENSDSILGDIFE